MDYSRLIHDYLDSEITSTSEEVLFKELSSNNELRSEFNTQLQLHLVAQNDISTISTPIESTNMIFSTLGFNIPSSSYLNAVNATKTTFFNRHMNTILASISTAFIASLIMFLMMDNSDVKSLAIDKSIKNDVSINSNNSNISKAIVSSSSVDEVPNNGNNNINSVSNNDKSNTNLNYSNLMMKQNSSSQNFDKNSKNNFERNIKSDSKLVNSKNDLSLKNEFVSNNDNNDNSNIELFNLNNSSINNINNLTQNSISVMKNSSKGENATLHNSFSGRFNNNNNNNIDFSNLLNEVSEILPKDFNLQVNSLSNKSLNEVNIPSSGLSYLNNLSLDLSYNLNENNTIGIEIGKEQFSQQFSRTIDGQNFSYSQNPSLFWYGIKYTLNLPELKFFNSVVPYASVFGGGTVSGPLAKAQLGMNYYINSYISINLSAEAGRLFYNVESTNYKTDKLGFSYGINLHY